MSRIWQMGEEKLPGAIFAIFCNLLRFRGKYLGRVLFQGVRGVAVAQREILSLVEKPCISLVFYSVNFVIALTHICPLSFWCWPTEPNWSVSEGDTEVRIYSRPPWSKNLSPTDRTIVCVQNRRLILPED